MHPDFREAVRERSLARQRGESVPARYEFKIERRDGEERWLDSSASSVEFGGRPAVLGIAFDVTERKRAEEQIKSLAYHDVAHRPAQPAPLQRPPRTWRWPRPTASSSGWACSSSTSIASRSSTTRWATASGDRLLQAVAERLRGGRARGGHGGAPRRRRVHPAPARHRARGRRREGGGEDPRVAAPPLPPGGPRAVRHRQHRHQPLSRRTGWTSRRWSRTPTSRCTGPRSRGATTTSSTPRP